MYIGQPYKDANNQHLEIISMRYLISRMDMTKTATVSRISLEYFDESGPIDPPAVTGSAYASSLACAYDSTWTPGTSPRTINIRYLPPTSAGWDDKNATVFYDIKSGLGNINGLWAR
jgi:hypothetical protein